ncbi:MAG TPA: AI-2E family transporter [Thermoanaerobaculia bacterium]|nr:AI-2E family transporter [Thermoanaerobaculia bacterium]
MTLRRSDRFSTTFLIALVVGTALLFFGMVRMFFVPVMLAAVFATLFHPLYRWLLAAFGGWRYTASFVTSMLLLVLLLLPIYLVGHRVTREAIDLLANLDQNLETLSVRAQEWLDQAAELPGVPTVALDEIDWEVTLREGAATFGGLAATVVRRTSRGTLQVVFTVFVTLFTMFYFFIDGRRIVQRVRYLVPLEQRYEEAIVARFVSVARASVKGTLVIAVVQGAIGGVTLAILGVEGAVLWGVVMFVLSVIPVIGAWMVMYPAALVQILLGNVWQGIVIVLVTMTVVINVDNVLRPRLVGQDSGLHDLLIFFSTLGGFVTFGAMGFIIGPVIAAFFVAVLDAYAEEFQKQLGPLTPPEATPPVAEPAKAPRGAGRASDAEADGDSAAADRPVTGEIVEGTEGRPPQR